MCWRREPGKGADSAGLRHTIGRPRLPQWTQGGFRGRKRSTENPHRNLMRHGAISAALAPRQNNAAATQNPSQRDYRLSLRPARARRLSKAGRHWAPMTRQGATRKERHSGLAWPTSCNKPNGRRPSWTAWGALSLTAAGAVHRKRNVCVWDFSGAGNRPLAAPAPLLECRSRPPAAVRRCRRLRSLDDVIDPDAIIGETRE